MIDPTPQVSIEDVARRAKVSISTVSRVVNRRAVVNEKTRERVEQAIRELGYRPNPFARALMLRRSEVIGLVLPDLHGEFYSEIIRGATNEARRLNYNLVVASPREGEESDSVLNALEERSLIDGAAVMVSELTDRTQQALARFRVPFVVLDDEAEGEPHDSVIIDQKAGAVDLMRHVVGRCAARRVIFVGGLETNIDTRARLQAYRQVMQENNIAWTSEDIVHLDYEFETAYEYARAHVREWAGSRHVVFAANDEMAAGIVTAALSRGVSIPRELGVVGFDDTRVARMTRPPLTTVRVPMSRMGSEAIALLCKRIADPDLPQTRISLRPELVIRESCGAVI